MQKDFVIYGEVVAKQRPRALPKTSKDGKLYSQIYTPKETTTYENLVKLSYRQECGNYIFPNDTPLSIEIKIFKALTKAFYNNKGELTPKGNLAIEGGILPLSKPDVDNCAKSILDALNKVAYNDDKQIVSLTVTKEYDLQDSVMVSIKKYEYKAI